MRELAPVPAIVQPADDLEQDKREVRKANVALQDAERSKETAAQEELRRLLAFGQKLVKVRLRWPAKSGLKAKPWGDFLRDCGIEEWRARDAMKYAGYVEEHSCDSQESLPDRREAGIDRKPRKSDKQGQKPQSEDVIEPKATKSEMDDVWDVTAKVMTRARAWNRDKRRALIHELRNLIDSLEAME